MKINLKIPGLLLSLACLCSSAWSHGRTHEHGLAQLNVAVEPAGIVLQLSSPLDNLVGFERAPATSAERQRVDAMMARIKAGATLFTVEPAAQCRFEAVQIDAPLLNLEQTATPADHGDLEARFELTCPDTTLVRFIDLALFEQFPGIRRIDIQVAGPKGQTRQTLRPPATRVHLTPR